MKILLSGYNVDTEVLAELKKNSPARGDVTPETLSAAYARISRDPRPVDELRAVARAEVEKARKSNGAIIFKMGHHSVAEHAVFNFDIIGVSRLAMEYLEHFRLVSYTEKSQRYITLGEDYIIPDEIKGGKFEDDYVAIVKKQNLMYHELFNELQPFVLKKHAGLAANTKNKSLLEGWAKEDARYITALGTLSQLGMTINARNLEYLFRVFASQSLAEVKALGREMYRLVEKIAPSIILFVEADDFNKKTYPELKNKVAGHLTSTVNRAEAEVSLKDFTPDADERILAALLYSVSGKPYDLCFANVKKMEQNQKEEIIKIALRHLKFYDAVLREFEFVNLTFELVVSASCFAQLKRHRMATIITQLYSPALGVIVPESIKALGREKSFMNLISEVNDVYAKMATKNKIAAQYLLTNAHRRRVLVSINVRELYHIVRLRADGHAQWDIKNISRQMAELAKSKMPIITSLLCGKDQYADLYVKLYGKFPTMVI